MLEIDAVLNVYRPEQKMITDTERDKYLVPKKKDFYKISSRINRCCLLKLILKIKEYPAAFWKTAVNITANLCVISLQTFV